MKQRYLQNTLYFRRERFTSLTFIRWCNRNNSSSGTASGTTVTGGNSVGRPDDILKVSGSVGRFVVVLFEVCVQQGTFPIYPFIILLSLCSYDISIVNLYLLSLHEFFFCFMSIVVLLMSV